MRRLMRCVQVLVIAVVALAAAVADAQSDSISGRWGRDGRTLLDLAVDAAGAVSGDAYFHGAGNPVRLDPRGPLRRGQRSGRARGRRHAAGCRGAGGLDLTRVALRA